MKKLIPFVLFLLTCTLNAFALEEKMTDGTIVHESSNPMVIDNFVDDVLSLLPLDMLQALESHREILLKEARFNVGGDYWRRQVIGKKEFKQRLESIPIKDSSELASQLGSNVENIFEIAMRPNGDDMMNEGLQKNMKDVLKKLKNETYVVSYHGYKGQSVDTILASLYEMKKYSKAKLYPDLVTTTADLWSALWQRGGGKTQLVTKTFVRKPLLLDFKKGIVPTIAPTFRK